MRNAFVVLWLVFTAIACGCDARVQRSNELPNRNDAHVPLPMGPTYLVPGTIEVTVGGSSFAIPRNYVRSASTGAEGELIIAALWPNFEGMTPENEREFSFPAQGRDIEIYLQHSPSGGARAVDIMVAIMMRNSVGPTEEHATTIGLIEHRAVGQRPGYNDEVGRQDYFVPASHEPRPIHIFCSTALSVPLRGGHQLCEELSVFENTAVKISFERTVLTNWREIDARAQALLDRFLLSQGSEVGGKQ